MSRGSDGSDGDGGAHGCGDVRVSAPVCDCPPWPQSPDCSGPRRAARALSTAPPVALPDCGPCLDAGAACGGAGTRTLARDLED